MFDVYLKSQLLFIFAVLLYLGAKTMNTKKLVSVDFEIYGKVQGVFFRKYTQQEANKLGLKGWCMNTESGTVQGIMEGEAPKIIQMKQWLEKTGSPSSRIEKAVFGNEREIKKCVFDKFDIRR